MFDHPLQRKIKTLDAEEYKDILRAQMRGLRLEYAIYSDRDDSESCAEIREEFKTVQYELLTFCRAEKRSNNYHGEKA